jgi:phthalate 4,5-dioxygenase oxygenase subunit
MLNKADNQLLTETGRDTAMGQFMREYWVPIARSSQLAPGAAPQRLTILGEKLVAFRSPNGQPGVMDEACPHRGASLALARNEDCGLRCVYHGWKIAPTGELLEAPTHPPDVRLRKSMTHTHPVHEGQGLLWTWLGKGEPPPFRRLAFTDLADDQVLVTTATLNCNWLHPLETLWDVFHAQILHNQTNRSSPRANAYFSGGGRIAGELRFDYPEMRVERTEYGFSYVNADEAKETTFYFVVPFIQHHATTPESTGDSALQISVPIDDDHCQLWLIFFNRFAPLKPDGFARKAAVGLRDPNNFMKGADERTPENRWGQDRAAMARGESFAGIVGMSSLLSTILAEDVLVIESQGRADRSIEHLAPTDRAIAEGRKTLLDAVRAHQRGEPPIGRHLDLSHLDALFKPKDRAVLAPEAGA